MVIELALSFKDIVQSRLNENNENKAGEMSFLMILCPTPLRSKPFNMPFRHTNALEVLNLLY